MSICGSWMMTLFATALAALMALWVLKTFGCPGAPPARTVRSDRRGSDSTARWGSRPR